MKDAIEMNISGLKCDACDYENREVKFEEYEKWVNKPCPECGANLLTEADFEAVKFLAELTKAANAVYPQREDDEEVAVMTMKANGSGKLEITDIRIEE